MALAFASSMIMWRRSRLSRNQYPNGTDRADDHESCCESGRVEFGLADTLEESNGQRGSSATTDVAFQVPSADVMRIGRTKMASGCWVTSAMSG